MKQAYKLRCNDCGYVKDFATDNWYWSSTNEGCCFKHECPKCKSKNYDRAPELEEIGSSFNIVGGNSASDIRSRLAKQMREDSAKLRSGDEKFLHNLAGNKPVNTTSGVKYSKDVKRGIRRR